MATLHSPEREREREREREPIAHKSIRAPDTNKPLERYSNFLSECFNRF